MNTATPHISDDLAASDERRAALFYVTEAFAEAVRDGIDSDCFAHAALFAAFQELVACYGEDAVAKFAEGLPDKVRHGNFTTASRH